MASIYSDSVKDSMAKFSISSSQLFNTTHYMDAGIELDDAISDHKYRSIFDLPEAAGFGDGGPNLSLDDARRENSAYLIPTFWSLNKTLRMRVLSFLDDKSLLVLRLVSSRIQHEVDFGVGIPAVIHCDKSNFDWMRNRDVRSCYVEKLDYGYKWDFLSNPSLLQKLTLSEEVIVLPQSILHVKKQFPNLVEYSFVLGSCTRDAFEPSSNDIHSEGIEKRTLQIIESTPSVYFLNVVSTNTWNLRWTIKMRNSNNTQFHSGMNTIGGNLQHISLNIPLTTKKDRSIWLHLLKHQQKLKSLVCDLGVVVWEQYAKIIYINAETLTHVALYGTVGWDLNSTEGRPFDWTMFEDCKLLSHLEIVCDPYFNSPDIKSQFMNTINLEKLNKQSLRYLFLEYFSFKQDEITNITNQALTPQLVKGILKNCAIEQVKMSEKSLPCNNAISIKRLSKNVEFSDCSSGTEGWTDDDLRNKDFEEEMSLQDMKVTEVPVDFFQGIIITGWTIIC